MRAQNQIWASEEAGENRGIAATKEGRGFSKKFAAGVRSEVVNTRERQKCHESRKAIQSGEATDPE